MTDPKGGTKKKLSGRGILRFLLRNLMTFVPGLLPRRVVRFLGKFFGFLWIDLLRVRKNVIEGNLLIAFPHWTDAERARVGRRSVYMMGENFLEFFQIPSLNSEWLEKHVVIEGEEHLIAAQAKQRGVFLLSLHLGNPDLAIAALALLKYPLHVISKKFKSIFFNELWFGIRGYHGVTYIDAHSVNNAFDILKTLRKKEIVIFVLDQFMGKPFGIATHFFGKKTGTAYGLALFYLKTKSPVVPVYTYEGVDSKMHICFQKSLDLDPMVLSDDKERTILRLTQYFNDKIEEIIRLHPEQWMWVHRRWKEFE